MFLITPPVETLRRASNPDISWVSISRTSGGNPQADLNLGLRYDRTFFPKFGKPEDNNTEVGDIDFNRGVYVLQKNVPSCAERGQAPCIPGRPVA